MNESVRLSPGLDWLLLSTHQQSNIQPRGSSMQYDFPNDDARLSVPRALEVVVVGDFFVSQPKLLGNEKLRPPELQTSSRTSVTVVSMGQRKKSGGKSEMDAGCLRKSIVKINKWIPHSTPGASNISISFLTSFFYFFPLSERERIFETPPTLVQSVPPIDKRAEFQRHSVSTSIETLAPVLYV